MQEPQSAWFRASAVYPTSTSLGSTAASWPPSCLSTLDSLLPLLQPCPLTSLWPPTPSPSCLHETSWPLSQAFPTLPGFPSPFIFLQCTYHHLPYSYFSHLSHFLSLNSQIKYKVLENRKCYLLYGPSRTPRKAPGTQQALHKYLPKEGEVSRRCLHPAASPQSAAPPSSQGRFGLRGPFMGGKGRTCLSEPGKPASAGNGAYGSHADALRGCGCPLPPQLQGLAHWIPLLPTPALLQRNGRGRRARTGVSSVGRKC